MAAPKNIKQVQKKHHCPECDELCKAVMKMPGKSMRYKCANGHDHSKRECKLQ